MVTNLTTPLTSFSAIHNGQNHSATTILNFRLLWEKQYCEIMSNNAQLCPYPRRVGINATDCPENESPSQTQQQQQQLAPPLLLSPPSVVVDPAEDVTQNAALDIERIGRCVNRLETSGWYYGRLSWQEATNLLKSTPVGTFLMRDSFDPSHLFALSVQTEYGPTSVRIHYADGYYKLDAENSIACRMPLFDCAVQLVDYYVRLSATDKGRSHVFLDETGRRNRPIFLDRPLYHSVPTLQHLCRININRHLCQPLNRIHLPKTLSAFIADYPSVR